MQDVTLPLSCILFVQGAPCAVLAKIILFQYFLFIRWKDNKLWVKIWQITEGFDNLCRYNKFLFWIWLPSLFVLSFEQRATSYAKRINRFIYLLIIQAYRNWVEIHGEEKRLPGLDLSPDQLYFLAFAQVLLYVFSYFLSPPTTPGDWGSIPLQGW